MKVLISALFLSSFPYQATISDKVEDVLHDMSPTLTARYFCPFSTVPRLMIDPCCVNRFSDFASGEAKDHITQGAGPSKRGMLDNDSVYKIYLGKCKVGKESS